MTYIEQEWQPLPVEPLTTATVTYQAVTNGRAVGYRVTSLADQSTEIVYLNPSHDDGDTTPDIFLYQDGGELDGTVCYVNVLPSSHSVD